MPGPQTSDWHFGLGPNVFSQGLIAQSEASCLSWAIVDRVKCSHVEPRPLAKCSICHGVKGVVRTKARNEFFVPPAATGEPEVVTSNKPKSPTRAGAYAWRDRCRRRRNMTFVDYPHHGAVECVPRYSRFMNGLMHSGILLNRKMPSEIAIHDPATFDLLVEKSEAATKAPAANAKAFR